MKRKRLYFNLALTNINKNKNSFFPFLLSAAIMTAMFYMLFFISIKSDGMYYGAEQLCQILGMGNWISGIVSVIIIFYTNSFLIKQRNHELGLYNVLGMEKKHIARVLTWEIVIVASAGIALGLIFGMVFAKLLFLILIKMVGVKPNFSFSISWQAAAVTVLLFGAVFFFVILWNLLRTLRLKPVELMRETHAGEQEPKAKWFLAILGIAALAVAYVLAITTKNPLEALNTFFIAVFLVIIGTYFLFMAGSIAFLKLLKKNKNFYYHKTHFITVSGMLYRMKQNAVGLASICILVTMVIVVFSTTVALYVGINDEQRVRFPKDVLIELDCTSRSQDDMQAAKNLVSRATNARADKKQVKIQNQEAYHTVNHMFCFKGKNKYSSYFKEKYTASDILVVQAMICEEYNAVSGENITLSGNTPALLTGKDSRIEGNQLTLDGQTLSLSPQGQIAEEFETNLYQSALILVPDYASLQDFQNGFSTKQKTALINDRILLSYSFDLNGNWDNKMSYGKNLKSYLEKQGIDNIYLTEDYYTSYRGSLGIYASTLFIGVFIGLLFLIATVLIIYYKQISEGYGDRKNFQIMSKIGLSGREIMQVINSQIRMVFLLPIAVAVMHLSFAFPIIRQILSMLNLQNVKLFIVCTIGTVLAFFLIYTCVYKITSRIYYRIVENGN